MLWLSLEVPPTQQVAAYNFVHVELGTQTGLVQLIALSQQCTASFKDLHIIGDSRRYWQLFSSVDPYTVVSNQFRLYSYSLSSCCCNDVLLCDLFGDPNSPHEVSRRFKIPSYLSSLLPFLNNNTKHTQKNNK